MSLIQSTPESITLLREYYSKIDFSFWDQELSRCFNQDLDVQNPNHCDAIRLYSTYLQFIEVFFLNIFAITENDLTNLFIGNAELHKKIESQAKMDGYKEFFFERWVFGIQEKHLINNYEKKRSFYSRLFDECIKDYLSDYDLLNAYKHGFRTHSSGPVSISLASNSGSGQPFLGSGFDSSVSFLSQMKDGKKVNEKIFEMTICFNWRYVAHKSRVILSMLENTVKILSSNGQGIELNTFFKLDENFTTKYSGNYRSSTELYTIKKVTISGE